MVSFSVVAYTFLSAIISGDRFCFRVLEEEAQTTKETGSEDMILISKNQIIWIDITTLSSHVYRGYHDR
jgi:hypothetical protein